MAIVELFIGAFITVLFEKLASGDLIWLARSVGIHSELNKWGNTLTQIQAVLVDAGQKHIRDRFVQLWLNKLQHLAYEIDDVLDDLATEAARFQVTKESYASNTSKVLKFIPSKFHALKYGLKMKSKLDEITTKLGLLVEEKNCLGLNDNVQRSGGASRPLEETSLVDESKVKGREGDKQALLENLLSNESSSGQNVNIVSIVGLGGIGKTTLAQLLYNDKDVKDHFELMSWVCVSDEFDVYRISKAIFKDVGGDDIKFETLNQLQVSLTDKFSKKRFLIVLDDVWTENYKEWELLQRPFTVGAPGSKILVTTRKKKVVDLMDSVEAYPLKVLSNIEAISLFAEHALGKQDFDSHPTLKLLGEGIVKKCDGLPLALITLGRVLRTKSNDEEWEELLNSEFWSSVDGSKILPALRLSYYDLPSHLKQMFTYCCLFPKDYTFDKDELVLLWMGEGLLYESNGNKSMENFGRKCFEELVSRSFFQHSTNNKSEYIMHDLINDLATSVAGEFFLMLGDNIDVNDRNEAVTKLHHLSFIRKEYDVYKKFMPLQRARRMRTFLATSVPIYDGGSYLSNKVLIELLPQLQFLRVLSLANYYITNVPESIGSLKHLRYLNVSNTSITCLPEQVGDLHNLQSLLLFGCHELSTLPKSTVKLINLRHLNITDTPKLNEMPLGLGRLTSLQTLSRVIIGGSGGYKISDLKSLLHIRGQLSIERINEVKNAVEAKEVNLQKKKGICDLQMKWSDVFDGSRNERIEYEVLEELRPFEKLNNLEIVNYSGTKFPSWVGDPSFVCLTQLTLRGCRGCTCLPTLGDLPSLQKLFVVSMHGLKRLGSELLGSSNAFPSLKVLELKDMNGWEEWLTCGDDKVVMFRCLREVSIISCPKLDVMAIELIPSLKVLRVENCSLAVVRSMVSVSSSISELKLGDIRGLTHLHGELLKHLKALECLHIYSCDELTYLWEPEAPHKILVSLQELEVKGCNNLVSLGEKDGLAKINLESVRKVQISSCPRLENYISPNVIETLDIDSCVSVTSLTFPTMNDLQSTLKNLGISLCDNVEQSWLLNNFLSSLEHLEIWNMPNLRLFPEGCLVHLTRLIIYGCDNLDSIPDTGYGFLPSLCLRYLMISGCKNLKSFPQEHLHSLTSLKHMWIYDCPSMDSSFACGLWPPNLSTLLIGGLKKPISEWGLQNFPTSLVVLALYGVKSSSGVISFAKAEEEDTTTSSSFLLPSSLTSLTIFDFMELESVSEGMQHLKCLKKLNVYYCPKLRDLPETLLPSLSSLSISKCKKLRKKCDSSNRRKGKYWPIISQIPDLRLEFA
ncbi:hypothetical protein SSX86_013236 [Deinandra increscens subsp. villosa]|uniref:Uncharacterized protein n=1 Tax=Deinandra increscens subsp. villosa TaxID=3103831 RepID=A0AAP0H413_9ASTR